MDNNASTQEHDERWTRVGDTFEFDDGFVHGGVDCSDWDETETCIAWIDVFLPNGVTDTTRTFDNIEDAFLWVQAGDARVME